MSFYTGGIDFSRLYETQATGNNGAAGGGNVGAVDSHSKSEGAVIDQFKKDVNLKQLKLQ